MLTPKVAKLLNEQITKEIYSAYLYLDMANYYSDQGLNGFENWFFIQAREEMDHAMLFRTYLLDNDETITLQPIDAPGDGYQNFIEPLEGTLVHERIVTASINAIYEAALKARDHRTGEFLTWFIMEQMEEEKNASDLVKKYQLFGDSKGLYDLDKELSARTYSAPSLTLD